MGRERDIPAARLCRRAFAQQPWTTKDVYKHICNSTSLVRWHHHTKLLRALLKHVEVSSSLGCSFPFPFFRSKMLQYCVKAGKRGKSRRPPARTQPSEANNSAQPCKPPGCCRTLQSGRARRSLRQMKPCPHPETELQSPGEGLLRLHSPLQNPALQDPA